MEDALKLQKDKDADLSEMEQMREQIRELKTLILQGAQGQAPPQQADDRKTIEKMIADMLEPYTPAQIEQAEKWVIKEIGGRLKVTIGPDEVPEITCNVMVANKARRDAGLTNLPDGFKVTNSVPVHVFAAYYMEIILDDSGTYQTEEERLLAIIEYSRAEGKKQKGERGRPLHPELEHLFKKDGETLKDKRRRPARTKKRGQ